MSNKKHDDVKPEATPPLPASTCSAPSAGLTYDIHHSRFGYAIVKVLRVDDEWAECEVVKGTLRGMGRGAVWGPGDAKSVRILHASWVPNEKLSHPPKDYEQNSTA